jgi:hypothetical protein
VQSFRQANRSQLSAHPRASVAAWQNFAQGAGRVPHYDVRNADNGYVLELALLKCRATRKPAGSARPEKNRENNFIKMNWFRAHADAPSRFLIEGRSYRGAGIENSDSLQIHYALHLVPGINGLGLMSGFPDYECFIFARFLIFALAGSTRHGARPRLARFRWR